MIATLTGDIAEKIADQVVLEVQGVGYGLLVTSEDFGALAVGNSARLYIYEHIREQSHDLFGFIRLETKALFEQLLGVNGVGPKMALNVLSIGEVQAVRAAIAEGDLKYIQTAPGVGKRVAERIVVDLKNKVGLEGIDLDTTGIFKADSLPQQDEAAAALMALGFTAQDAQTALQNVAKDISLEERVRLALKHR